MQRTEGMRHLILAMGLLLLPPTPALAQVSIQIGLPGVSIGINQPVYPQFVQVPGYPVYYAPQAASNYFFYDGMYWVFQGDSWYASYWYNGPWALVAPQYVPVFILRVPVSYYRHPPSYFRGWQPDGPPRWGERWGHDWEREHGGWDRWDRSSAPRPAPLPTYQKQYSGNRYPPPAQQQELQKQKYRYQPSDPAVRRVEEAHAVSRPSPQPAPSPSQAEKKGGPPQQQPQPQHASRPSPQAAPEQTHGGAQQTKAHTEQAQPPRPPQENKGGQDKGGHDKGGQDKGNPSGDKANAGQDHGQGKGPDHEK